VQCGRDPPCVRHTYLTAERCRGTLRADGGWPTHDAHVQREQGWASAGDLLHAHARNRTVLVVGDSVAHGWYAGLLCEVTRSGLTVSDDVHHPALRALQAAVAMQSGWDHHPVNLAHVAETGSVLAYKGYAKPSARDSDALLAVADVLLINYGSHYDSIGDYEEDMGELFEALGDFQRQPCKAVVFRETAAQGVETEGPASRRCGPGLAEPRPDNLRWAQNELVQRLGRQHRVPILGYYNDSLARWAGYEEKYCEIAQARAVAAAGGEASNVACTDCTNFCMSPTWTAKNVHDW